MEVDDITKIPIRCLILRCGIKINDVLCVAALNNYWVFYGDPKVPLAVTKCGKYKRDKEVSDWDVILDEDKYNRYLADLEMENLLE